MKQEDDTLWTAAELAAYFIVPVRWVREHTRRRATGSDTC